LPNGVGIETSRILVTSFDVVAVCLFAAEKEWTFAFALSEDLARATTRGVSEEGAKYLLATTHKINFPIAHPYSRDFRQVFDRAIKSQKRHAKKTPKP
jgi:hypothetical protein